jgi:Core-2/I-Branching enzyme
MTDPTATTGNQAPRFAYMLLTHKDPEHVEELAQRVLDLSPAGHVVIHHDQAADSLPWQGNPPARVHFVDRERVLWGDWSIVDASLRMIRYAHDELSADWYVMLSGEHRPVVDLSQWERATMAAEADAFVEAQPLASALHFGRRDEDANRFLARCRHRWVTINPPRVRAAQKAMGVLWRLSRYVLPLYAIEYSHRRDAWFFALPRRRGRPRGTTFYKGTQWIGFNRRSAGAILGTDQAMTEWFKWGHIPDETYFHTVLYNTPGLKVSTQIVTFVPEGPERPTASRWMVLDEPDLAVVWSSPAAFARKVDPDERPHIIKAIDERVNRQRGTDDHAGAEGPAA